MALIKCSECGHEVSEKASTCPNCGCPIKKGKIGFGWKKPIIAFVVLLAIVGGAYAVWGFSDGITKDIQITQELAKAVHQYSEIDNFHEGLAGVRKNGMWGFINSKGEEVVSCQYERIESFNEGLACVRKDGKWGYIDTKGNVAIPFTYIAAGSFSEGLACFYADYSNHPLGFIDKKGEIVIPAKYFGEYVSEESFSTPSFKNGICKVFSEDISVFYDENKVVIIDTKGEITESKYINDNDTENSQYVVFEESGKYGIRDTLNNVIVAAKYSNIDTFSEGLAAVYLYGENTICGFVDKKGNDTFTKEDWEKLSQYEQSTLQAEANRIEDELLEQEKQQSQAENIKREGNEKVVSLTVELTKNNHVASVRGSYGATLIDGGIEPYGENIISKYIKIPDGKVWIYKKHETKEGNILSSCLLYYSRGNSSRGLIGYDKNYRLSDGNVPILRSGDGFIIGIGGATGGLYDNSSNHSATFNVYFIEKSEEYYY